MRNIKDFKHYFFECQCKTPDHSISIMFDTEDKTAYLSTQLYQYNSFWKRLLASFKYVFNFKRTTSHWDETILDEDKFMDLYDVMTRFIYKAGLKHKSAIKIKKALDEIASGSQNSAMKQHHKTGDITNKYKQRK